MESDRPIIGYCSYCKEKIYAGEAYVIYEDAIYHASETNEHDNCYLLIIEGEGE